MRAPIAPLLAAALVAALWSAAAARASPAPQRLAVLELEVAPGLKIDRTYFSDLARGAVHRRVPGMFVMTRESTEALLAVEGKSLGDCQGACEVEVGRKLGADFIVSGRIAQVGSWLSLTLRLFATADGRLVETAEARGKGEDELVERTEPAVAVLVGPLLAGAPAAGGPAAIRAPEPARTAEPALVRPAEPAPLRAAEPAPVLAAEPAPARSAEPVAAPPPRPDAGPAPGSAPAARALPAPSEALQQQAPEPARPGRALPWVALGAGLALGAGSAVFDNRSSTSHDGKLGVIDFLPVAGYALALALGGWGVLQLVKP